MNAPYVSVILPVYNGEKYIRNTLDSILRQTFEDFEVIAIDDGSKDNSVNILREYANKDPRVKVFTQDNHGICATRNRGISLAIAPYIMFCDHDDEYLPGYMRDAYLMISHNQVDFVKFGCKEIYIDGDKIVREYTEVLKPKSYQGYRVKEFLLQYQKDNEYIWDGIYTKHILEEIGGFDEKYKFGCEDLALMLDLAEKARSCICNPKVYYIHNIRNSFSTSRKYHENTYRDVIETGKRRFEIIKPTQYPEYEQYKLRMLIWAMCGMFAFPNCTLTSRQIRERFETLYNSGYRLSRIDSGDQFDKKKKVIFFLFQFRMFSLLAKICVVKRKMVYDICHYA